MKHVLASIFAVLAVLLAAGPDAAQEVVRERLDPQTSLLMFEIGAIATLQEGADAVTFARILPKEMRSEENRDVDVEKGDEVLMMNGERIRSIADLRKLYEGLGKGQEVKLGLKRGSERFLVRFTRQDRQMAMGHGGGEMRIVVAGDGGGEAELLHEAGALLREEDGAVKVAAQLPGGGELEEGDVVTEANGKTLASLADYRAVYEALAIGDALKLVVKRGGESLTVEVEKAERPAGMMVLRGDGR